MLDENRLCPISVKRMIPLSGLQCILNFGNVVPRCLDWAQNLGYAAAVYPLRQGHPGFVIGPKKPWLQLWCAPPAGPMPTR